MGDQHCRDRERILLVFLRSHHKSCPFLIKRVRVNVLEGVFPVRGRIQDYESGLVCTFLVGCVLVVLPSGFVGYVRFGERACGVGIHTTIFLDCH